MMRMAKEKLSILCCRVKVAKYGLGVLVINGVDWLMVMMQVLKALKLLLSYHNLLYPAIKRLHIQQWYATIGLRVRITVSGDKLPYHDDAGSPAADLLETKILLNSTILDAKRGARFMCLDIKDHFLATPMQHPEYMRVKMKYIPEDIRQHYNVYDIVTKDDWVYIKIQKGMPGLRQAAILAYKHLKNSLEPYGYTPIPGTVGLWKHNE